MDFQVVNFSDADKTYRLDTTVLGQTAQGGQFKHGKVTYLVSDYPGELDAAVTSSAADGAITVPANSTAKVSVTVTLSDADKAYMDERFPYGSYVEGFVQLLSEDNVTSPPPSWPSTATLGKDLPWRRGPTIPCWVVWNTDTPQRISSTTASGALAGI